VLGGVSAAPSPTEAIAPVLTPQDRPGVPAANFSYTLSKGRMVHNLVYEPRKGESDDPGYVSCDSRYRHHRGVLRYRHPVVVVDASLGRLYTMGSESCPLAGLRPFVYGAPNRGRL
jgi:hypothetical protein